MIPASIPRSNGVRANNVLFSDEGVIIAMWSFNVLAWMVPEFILHGRDIAKAARLRDTA